MKVCRIVHFHKKTPVYKFRRPTSPDFPIFGSPTVGLGNVTVQIYYFNQFHTQKILMLSRRYESSVEHGYMCPRGLPGPHAVTMTKWLKF